MIVARLQLETPEGNQKGLTVNTIQEEKTGEDTQAKEKKTLIIGTYIGIIWKEVLHIYLELKCQKREKKKEEGVERGGQSKKEKNDVAYSKTFKGQYHRLRNKPLRGRSNAGYISSRLTKGAGNSDTGIGRRTMKERGRGGGLTLTGINRQLEGLPSHLGTAIFRGGKEKGEVQRESQTKRARVQQAVEFLPPLSRRWKKISRHLLANHLSLRREI